MNVLLIYQKIPDTFWSFAYALRFKGFVFAEVLINMADDPDLLDMMVKVGFDSDFIGGKR